MEYEEISRKVGFTGIRPFPEKEDVENLCVRLSETPGLEDFTEALALYRFTPLPSNASEMIMMKMVEEALREAKKKLWPMKDNLSPSSSN